MRKINQMVVAQQEAFEFFNMKEEELTPFWEARDHEYDLIYDDEYDDGLYFYEKQADDYYNQYVKGHTWEEIENDEILMSHFSFWSDLHKDAYGFRPRWV